MAQRLGPGRWPKRLWPGRWPKRLRAQGVIQTGPQVAERPAPQAEPPVAGRAASQAGQHIADRAGPRAETRVAGYPARRRKRSRAAKQKQRLRNGDGFRPCRWRGRRTASGWASAAGAADIGARTGWGLAEVKGAPSAAGSPACVDVFSTLSAELAVSDSAAPKTATAAAEMVTFLACETSQGRSLRGSSLRGVSAAGESESVSTGPTVAMAIVSATGVIVFFGRDIRHGRSRGSVDGVSPASSRPTVASAAPRARASWVSPESETGIGRASAIGWVTSSRSASAPTRYKLSGNQPSRRKTVRSQSMRSSAVSQVSVTAVRTAPAPVATIMTVAASGSRMHRAVVV